MMRLLLTPLSLLLLPSCTHADFAAPSSLDSTIAHGMIIDAGSSGSRMHVYEWEPRMFKTLPPPISIPGSTNQWTHRMEPGISSFSTHVEDIPEALAPLVEFAKDILKDHEKEWGKFPIYLKATAGMRQLSYNDREAILREVREFLSNPETCPFFFSFDQARVISGEEEGIYGWAAVNFLHGNLLTQSEGAGTANPSANMTVGTLDLGGASTQISFFKSDQDVLANLFKLQIGGQKHWNVYTHSFLQFGLNSARLRMQTKVAEAAVASRKSESSEDSDSVVMVVDDCLPTGFNETFVSPKDGKEFVMVPAEGGADFDACDKQTFQLLESQSPSNNFCQFAFPGQCSVLGTYQPELPKGKEFGRFYGFAGYYKLWQFLNLPEVTSVKSIADEGRRVCGMSHDELSDYNEGRKRHKKNIKYLPRYCFMSSYIATLLKSGFGFPEEEHITFVDEVGGYKVDWALGSMLYEINALPWSYVGPDSTSELDCTATSKGVQEAVDHPEAASTTNQQSDGGDAGSANGRRHFPWAPVAAAGVAVAALVWGYLERSNGRRRTEIATGGDAEESSPWRVGVTGVTGADGGGPAARRSSSQYESISDVSPRV